MPKILLAGNPNVGKSVLFSRLTSVHVVASNYPGTTVEFTEGRMRLGRRKGTVIDVPGTYSFEATCKAEEIATKIIEESSDEDVIINVIDSTNLERNLLLTLQLLEQGKPMIVALNFWDETKHKGVTIDTEQLEKELGVPVIPISALRGEGIKELVGKLGGAKPSRLRRSQKTTTMQKWQRIGRIVKKVQTVESKHHTLRERIADLSVQPFFGIPMAAVILFGVFKVIRAIGEGLIGYVFEPLFENYWSPVVLKVSEMTGGEGLLHDILVGPLADGEVEYVESLGMLTTGLFVPIGMVLPYVAAFYIVLSILEDIGYLPRLAVLIDNLMHKIGLHGLSIVPMLLGLGCNVPGVLSARILESRRERFIAMTLMCVAVPCMAQIAMIMGLLGEAGAWGMSVVFGTLFAVWIVLGFILNKIMKGESPEMFVEIPPYRTPCLKAVFKKMWMRIKKFLMEAVPYVLIGVFIINILYSFGVIDFVGKITAPIVTGILGLPEAAVGALIVGFLRKDVAVGMLLPLGLTTSQLIIASVVLAMYFPCIATFAVLVRELGVKDSIKSAMVMIGSTLLVGGMLNLILH